MMEFIENLIETSKSYGVNPIAFLIIYFGSTPFLLVPVYYLGRIATKKTDRKYFWPLLITLILAILAPYLYLILFGEGIHIFIKIIIALIAGISLSRYLYKKLNIDISKYIRGQLPKKHNNEK